MKHCRLWEGIQYFARRTDWFTSLAPGPQAPCMHSFICHSIIWKVLRSTCKDQLCRSGAVQYLQWSSDRLLSDMPAPLAICNNCLAVHDAGHQIQQLFILRIVWGSGQEVANAFCYALGRSAADVSNCQAQPATAALRTLPRQCALSCL